MRVLSSKVWRLVAGILLAGALLALFFRGVEWRSLRQAFGTAEPAHLAGVVLATVVVYAIRAWRWGALLAPLAPVPFKHLVSATLIGFTSGMLVPRAGEIVRPYLIARRYPISTSSGFASIILERLVDLITVLALFALYLYVLPHPASQTRGPLMGVIRAGGAVAGGAAVAVLVLLLALYRHADKVLALAGRVLRPVLRRHAEGVLSAGRSFADGLAVLQASPRHLLAIFGQSVVLWLGIGLTIHWNNRAFGIDLPFHSTFLMLALLTLGVAVPTPGNVGGFHAAYRMMLTQVYGVDDGTAVAAGLASHALGNLPVLLLGLAFLGSEGLSVGKVAQMTDAAPDPPRGDGPLPRAAS
jgi:glycosyltransferase 2 family protein